MLMALTQRPLVLYDRVEVAHQQGSKRHTALPSHCKYAWMFEVAPLPLVCVVLLLRWSSLSHPLVKPGSLPPRAQQNLPKCPLPFPPPFFINFPIVSPFLYPTLSLLS